MRRYQGYLRPPSIPLPMFMGEPYVDDAAFELFAPATAPGPNDTIVFILQTPATFSVPRRRYPATTGQASSRDDRHDYPGRHSRDGLYRHADDALPPDPTRIDPATIHRFQMPMEELFTGATWQEFQNYDIYPITGYIQHSFPNRSADESRPGNSPEPMVGALEHWTLSTGPSLTQVSSKRLVVPGTVGSPSSTGLVGPLNVLAPVGVKVADILPNHPGNEVMVTGMFGEVLIYGFDQQSLTTLPLQVMRLEGCMGLHGSIEVEGGSVYIAGSLGLWKLEVE